MPRMSESALIRKKKILVANIDYYLSRNNMTYKQLAKKIDMDERTLRRRRKNIKNTFKMEELERIANIFNVSWITLVTERTCAIDGDAG